MEGSGVGSDDSAMVHDRQQMVSAVKMLVSGCIMKKIMRRPEMDFQATSHQII